MDGMIHTTIHGTYGLVLESIPQNESSSYLKGDGSSENSFLKLKFMDFRNRRGPRGQRRMSPVRTYPDLLVERSPLLEAQSEIEYLKQMLSDLRADLTDARQSRDYYRQECKQLQSEMKQIAADRSEMRSEMELLRTKCTKTECTCYIMYKNRYEK